MITSYSDKTVVKTVRLYKPLEHQKAVHDAISKHIAEVPRYSDEFQKVFLVVSRRQVGKSALAENELLRCAFTMPHSVSAYLTTSFKLCKKMFEEMEAMLEGTGLVTSCNKSDLQIILVNGSRIEFFSAEQRDKLRGFTVSGIFVIDEAAFIADDIYYSKVKVWTNAKRAITLMVSSPDFESGFFYDLHMQGLNGSPYVQAFNFNDYDLTSIQSIRALEEARLSVPPQVYRSEYLGLYRKAEGTVFGNFEKQILLHEAESPEELYFGIDFGTGSGGDYTVLAGFNHKRQLCYLWRNNDMQPLGQVKHIGSVIRSHKGIIKGIYAEENSIGKIYLNLLKEYGHIQPFNTNSKTKRKIIENLQVDIQKGLVWFPNNRELKGEFSMYESKQQGQGLTYGAPMGEHDDIVMATAIANWCYTVKNNSQRIRLL